MNGYTAPLAFFSRKLNEAEKRYSAFDKELLAVFSATQHFKHLLEATKFDILTDHLPLVHAFTKKTDPVSNRQQRQLSAISEFSCTIKHISGRDNTVADALSRNTIATINIGVDLHRLQKCQEEEKDDEQKETTLSLKNVSINDRQILCDTSMGKARPWIPAEMRREV